MLKLTLSSCRIGQETLMEENLLDDDIETELAPVVVQLGYVQQVLSKCDISICLSPPFSERVIQ